METSIRWCKSGRVSCCWSRRTTSYDELVSLSVSDSNARILWKILWRKIQKAKKKMYRFSESTRFSYEACEYAQNFDHGIMANDSDDNSSRSFSARFAVSNSAIFHPLDTTGLTLLPASTGFSTLRALIKALEPLPAHQIPHRHSPSSTSSTSRNMVQSANESLYRAWASRNRWSEDLRCDCGEPATFSISRTNENPGRSFKGCPNFQLYVELDQSKATKEMHMQMLKVLKLMLVMMVVMLGMLLVLLVVVKKD
ncbi:hypothetical protein LXL04_002083 [Taraxacum kok-saghyz]